MPYQSTNIKEAIKLAEASSFAKADENKRIVQGFLNKAIKEKDMAKALNDFTCTSFFGNKSARHPTPETLKRSLSKIPPTHSWKIQAIVAEGDLVWVHSRFSKFLESTFMSIDMYRVENGRITQHWCVLRSEIQGAGEMVKGEGCGISLIDEGIEGEFIEAGIARGLTRDLLKF